MWGMQSGGMRGNDYYGNNDFYGSGGGMQGGMMGAPQQGGPYRDYMAPPPPLYGGQEGDMFMNMYEVQNDVVQRFWDDPAAVRYTGIVARMVYQGNQELLEPKYFFLSGNGTVDLGSGIKADVTFDGMDRIGLSDRAFVITKTKDSVKLQSYNAKDCNLVRGRDGKVEVIKQGDKDISIYQGDSIQFKDDPNYSGYERFDILFHNAPAIQKVPIQWDEEAMSEMDDNDMPPMRQPPEPNFGRPKVSPLSLARKRALFAISTKIMSMELLSDEIQVATNVETIEELLAAALDSSSPVIDVPSSQKLDEEKLGQVVKWEVSKLRDEEESDETELPDDNEEPDEEETPDEEEEEEEERRIEEARLAAEEEEARISAEHESRRRAEEEKVRLAKEAEAKLSEEQQKIEEAKAQYISELESKREASLTKKGETEVSLDEALQSGSEKTVDGEMASEPEKVAKFEVRSEKEEIKPAMQMNSKEVKPEIRPEQNAEADAKKLLRFRELQKKVQDAHHLLRNPPPDPITNDIRQKQQAARDIIEKAHLTPCFFEAHGGCKDPNCFFLHEKKPKAANTNPNKPVSKTYPKATPIPKISTEATNQRGILYEWHEKGRKSAFGYIRLDSGEELYCTKDSFVKKPIEFRESMPVKVEAILRCDSRKPGQRDEAKNVRLLD